jgi:hypothetical protein
MLRILEDFIAADPEQQRLYQVGRRCGWLSRLGDLADPAIVNPVRQLYTALGVTADNVEGISEALMQRFI